MAEHTIETRILLRYDTLSNWLSSTVILKRGEAAIAAIPNDYTIEGTNHRPENTPPAIGIKVGDGYHYFTELPWVQGVAGDVYSWAKQQYKPEYNANEIIGLSTLIQQYINSAMGGGGSGGDVTIEARSYRLVKGTGANANKYYLQSRGANDDDWITDELNFIDLGQLAEVMQWLAPGFDDYWTITGYTNQKIADKLNTLNYSDTNDVTKVVTAVDQVNGQISVTHHTLSANNLSDTLSVSHGGTGRSELTQDTVLVGDGTNRVQLIPVEDELVNNNNFATNRAIKTYIDQATAGIEDTMHFIGESNVEIRDGSTVNPNIEGYTFSQAKTGDAVLFNNQEFIWNGSWRVIGGAYAIKGTIVNADIADEAEIAQSKIENLTTDLASKVDKEVGKSLSTNDFTDEYKNKLDNIEDNAQENVIEHVYVNGVEISPTTIENQPKSIGFRVSALTETQEELVGRLESGEYDNKIENIFLNGNKLDVGIVKTYPKSVNIIMTEFTEQEKQKLADIEPNAQENIIEKIYFNESLFEPNENKEVHVVIDEAALNLEVIKGAVVPSALTTEEVSITQDKKLELARIAKTGHIEDILQNNNSYVILNCGSSIELI